MPKKTEVAVIGLRKEMHNEHGASGIESKEELRSKPESSTLMGT
jgi:hypothetical protein